ncbi:MAG: hypothetical protein ACLFP8_02675 [Alphaproteobacteria bacterium]
MQAGLNLRQKLNYEDTVKICRLRDISYSPVQIKGVNASVGIGIRRTHVIAKINDREFLVGCRHSGISLRASARPSGSAVLDIYMSEILPKDNGGASEEERGIIKQAIIQHSHRPGIREIEFHD